MSKGLDALKDLMYYSACCRCQYYIDKKCTNKDECCWKTIEKELKDYEWLKSKINIDFFYQLPREDRVKLMEIMGVKYEQ